MSVPPATKNVSDHPPATAVTDPINKQDMQADVDRKMRLWGVISAFRNGRIPSNQQIDETLIYARDHAPVDVSKLSPDGRKLTEDTRAIIETARMMVQEKNADELFQNFVYHTSDANVRPKTADAPLTQEEMKGHASEGARHLRTLLQLLLTNSEARKLLSDVTLIGRDLFAQGASAAAQRMRPTADQMANVNDAAPSTQWTEQQKLDGDHVGAANGVVQHLKETHKDLAQPSDAAKAAQADPTLQTTSPQTDPLQPAGMTAAPAPAAAGTTPTTDAATTASPTSPTTATAAQKKSFMKRFSGFSGKVPQEHRDRATAELQGIKKNLQEQFPEERRDQFIYRLKKVVVECQSHPQYKEAIEWFLTILETYFGHAKNMSSDQAGHATNLFESDPALKQTTTEARTLAERFANNKSLDDIINAIQRLWQDTRDDEELREWWKRVDKFARKTLLEPGFILQPQFNNEANALQDQSHVFFDQKYKGHKDALFNSVSAWFKAFGDDPLNQQFGDDWNRLTKHLLFDDSGSLTFKPHLWNDVRNVIAPTLVQQVGYIPIPRIEYSDRALDLVIENLTLQGRNLFPNIIELNAQNYFKVSPYGSIKDVSHHSFTLSMSQIQADLRDVAFYYNKKSGFPKIRDSGLADVFLGGEGISVRVKLSSTDDGDHTSVFKVKEIAVKVDALKFAIKDAKHGFLYKTLRPLATGLIKKQIARAISDGIRTGLELLDQQLVEVRDRMADKDGLRSQAMELKSIFSKRASDVDATTSSIKSKRESKFKFMPTRDSMILPEHGHDSAWTKKQFEREDLAKQGDGWRSHAFSVVPNAAAPAPATAPAPAAPAATAAAA